MSEGRPEKTRTRFGRVRWFSQEKGFGLIESAEGGLFVVDHPGIVSGEPNGHVVAPTGFKTLESGCEVEFELSEDARGRLLASSVRAVGNPERQTGKRTGDQT